MFKIEDTFLSQYANSPKMFSIIQEIYKSLDPQKTEGDFYKFVWSLDTAKGFGLDIWGRIVGISRSVPLQDPSAKVFGFNTGGQSNIFTPFSVAPFRTNANGFSSYMLPDNLYRKLIFSKALANITLATAPNINKLLKTLIATPSVYLITGIMEAKYQFQERLSAFDRMVVFQLGLLPEPCGVKVTYEEII